MSRTIHLIGARGGQGTTTVAAALALLAAGHHDTALVSSDPAATAALLGVPLPLADERAEVTATLSFTAEPDEHHPAEVTVVDGGAGHLQPSSGSLTAADGERYAVLRGPCYVALASLLTASGGQPDGVILVLEQGRALTAKDVIGVLDLPVVATVKANSAVARTIDAGLIVSRLHRLPEFADLRRLARSAPPHIDPRQRRRQSLKTVTDLPLPHSGNGAEGRARCQSLSRPRPTAAHRTAWGYDRTAASRAEHRQTGSRSS